MNNEVSPEIPGPDYRATEAAFEQSLGSNFGTASIIEEEQAGTEEKAGKRLHARSVLTSMRQLSVRDHRAAGMLAVVLGAFGMHKFYLGYHTQGFLLLLGTILLGTVSFGLGALAIWLVAIVEGATYFAMPQDEFERIYVEGTHNWF